MNCLKIVSKTAIMMIMLIVITAMTATGAPLVWDLSAVDSGLGGYTTDDNTTTNVFSNIVYEARSTTTYNGATGTFSVGDTFTTNIMATATWLCPVTGSDTEGMNIEYEVTFVASELTGFIDSISDVAGDKYHTNAYTGGSLEMFVDTARNSLFSNGTGFDDGTMIARIEDIAGSGFAMFSDYYVTSSYNLSGDSTYLLDDFWYDGNMNELNLLNLFLCGNTINGCDIGCASANSTPVPEPATLLLFGTGLVGLAGFRGKKKK